MHASRRRAVLFLALIASARFSSPAPLLYPSETRYTERAALGMIRASETTLAPVYAPLAEQIAREFDLRDKKGIGIDLGSGPGTLIIELCKRTKLYWINADINPHFFPYFFEAARAAGFGNRVGAVFADAQALPFRDDYADVIVSRGSFHFWEDKTRAFGEIFRVLKPGGIAFIGRGFPDNLPLATARKIREAQGRKGPPMNYDRAEMAAQLRGSLKRAGIRNFRIRIPKPPGAGDINYGIWVEFRKPADRGKTLHQ